MLLLETMDAADLSAEDDLEARFEAFVASHRERALRLAWRLVGGDHAAAEDVTQDALVRAHGALARFRGEARLETWFYRILVRQASSHRRWRRVRERFGRVDPESAVHPRPAAAGDPFLRQRIGRALETLSAGQRQAFVMVHLEGMSVSETAEILGRTAGTIKSHLHRALAKLRQELGDLRDGREEEDHDR